MNISSASSTYLGQRNTDMNNSFYSEKIKSPSRRVLSPHRRDLQTSFDSTTSKRRLSPLGRKIDNVHASYEADHKTDTTEFERRVKIIDERITVHQNLIEENLKTCAVQGEKVAVQLLAHADSLDVLNEVRIKELKELEENVISELELESQKGKVSQQQMLRGIDDKTNSFRHEVAAERQKTSDTMAAHHQEVEMKVNALHEGIENEKKTRKEENETIIRKVSSQINKIQETLIKEKKIRQDTEDFLFKSLEDLNKKFQYQVKTEQDNREKSEEQMIRLLDEACSKLENHTIPQGRRSTNWLLQ